MATPTNPEDVPDPQFEGRVLRGKPRAPAVPFDPRSPQGRKHPEVHSTTGSVYKCRKNLGLDGPDAPTHPYRRLRIAQYELEACHVGLRHRQRSPTPQVNYDRLSDVKFLDAMYVMCGDYASVLKKAGEHHDKQVAQLAQGARSESEAQRLLRNADRLQRHILRHGELCNEVGAELSEAHRRANDAVAPARQRLDFSRAL